MESSPTASSTGIVGTATTASLEVVGRETLPLSSTVELRDIELFQRSSLWTTPHTELGSESPGEGSSSRDESLLEYSEEKPGEPASQSQGGELAKESSFPRCSSRSAASCS
ncbi:unnamed protein product [Cochlearia groenlandica]